MKTDRKRNETDPNFLEILERASEGKRLTVENGERLLKARGPS